MRWPLGMGSGPQGAALSAPTGASALLLDALLHPTRLAEMSPARWDLLIRQARRANLLGALHRILLDGGLLESVPDAPRQHLISADTIARRQAVSVRWEVRCIGEALATLGEPLVLLKGAAYTLAGLPLARGRLYSDVDILVPSRRISVIESALMLHGWQASQHDAYDQHYYRAWMHEIPPLQHGRRGTTIDVHHSILPLAAAPGFDAQALLDAAVPVAGQPGLRVLQPVDMVLHSATHLFHEGEFMNGLRDLFDLDGLLRHFGNTPDFWERLVPRAIALHLTRPLWYALQLSMQILGTPLPPEVVAAAQVGRPNAVAAPLMSHAYRLALRPVHASVDAPAVRVARFGLYLRSHWLRVPLPLLVRHLGRKAWLRLTENPAAHLPGPARERDG